MRVTPEALVLLRAKYSEMLALRLALSEGGGEDPMGRRARLAAQFPGALREIDELPLDDIRARIAALDATSAGADELPWMQATLRFHELTHAILAAKRWLNEGGHEGAEAPPGAAPWKDDLARVESPPGGRLSVLVLERIAVELGTTPEGVRALVFPRSRVSRRSGRGRLG